MTILLQRAVSIFTDLGVSGKSKRIDSAAPLAADQRAGQRHYRYGEAGYTLENN